MKCNPTRILTRRIVREGCLESLGIFSRRLQQFLSQQSNAATSATQLQQGQDVVVNALQQKFKSASGVNIDSEMANLISLQNNYAANAHVMSVVQAMMTSLLQVQV